MIRKAKYDDLMDICTLIHDNLANVNSSDYTEHVINFMISYYSSDKLKTMILKNDNFYVYEDNLSVIACILLENCEAKALYVSPLAHKKGIGKKLMLYIENLNLCTEISLYASETAYSFYKRLGYKLITPTDDPDFGPSYYMKKTFISTL